MFSVRGAGLSHVIDPNIIRKLTAIRVSGYKLPLINQEISITDEKTVSDLVLGLGEKILKVNLIEREGTEHFKAVRTQFKEILTQLSKNRLALIVYAADLLQFYTIICAQQFNPNGNLHEFQQLLSNGSNKFGETQDNLFIIEYQLTQIYNELVLLGDTFTSTEQTSKDLHANFKLIETELHHLRESIDKKILAEPDNVFLQYLSFLHSYASAKHLELRYIVEEKQLSKEEIVELYGLQELFLNAARSAIDQINALNQFYAEYKVQYAKGLEFALGQDLLRRFPEFNLVTLREHLSSLLPESGSNVQVKPEIR